MNNSFLSRIPRLLLEALSVVFAVLVALAVDEWNEERELREQAARARVAIVSELQANQEELRAGTESSQEMLESATGTLRSLRRGEELPGSSFQGNLPDFSDAAWQTARVTGIVSHMEYDWVLETARVYETQALVQELQGGLLGFFGSLVARAPDEERFADLVGQLALLNSFQTQLGDKIDSLLERTSGGQTQGESTGSPPNSMVTPSDSADPPIDGLDSLPVGGR
jgi:hypothetical protein